MASSSSGNSVPAPEAVQVLVALLADESPVVREASMASLKDVAPIFFAINLRNPLLVLDCCSTVSRGGRRRFGNIAGVFQVMSVAIHALDNHDVDPSYMAKLAKLATAEVISSKELTSDWQRAASGVLVAIGSHFPDLTMEEIFLHLSGSNSALPAMVQILADFASFDALQFTPRLKGVLSRVLPIIGNVRDAHRPIFSHAYSAPLQSGGLLTVESFDCGIGSSNCGRCLSACGSDLLQESSRCMLLGLPAVLQEAGSGYSRDALTSGTLLVIRRICSMKSQANQRVFQLFQSPCKSDSLTSHPIISQKKKKEKLEKPTLSHPALGLYAAFRCWCQACWLYSVDFSLSSVLDGDVMSFLNSAFELLLRVWTTSRDLKVRASTVEALGQMVGLVTRTQLKAALPRLVPAMLELLGNDQDIALLATCSLHNLLNATLLSESGPPLLDFEVRGGYYISVVCVLLSLLASNIALASSLLLTFLLHSGHLENDVNKKLLHDSYLFSAVKTNTFLTLLDSSVIMLLGIDLTVILSTLLPVVYTNSDSQERSNFLLGLKTYNEVQHCFLTVGLVYPEDLFVFLLNKCRLKEQPLTFGALCVLKHLLPRLSEAWHSLRPSLTEAVKLLLDEQSLGVRKALSELIVVMASHCYLVGPSGELFVEYLVRLCAMSDRERNDLESSKGFRSNGIYPFQYKRLEVKIGGVCPTELRAICEKSLLLLTITIPEMEFPAGNLSLTEVLYVVTAAYSMAILVKDDNTAALYWCDCHGKTPTASISALSHAKRLVCEVCRCISELCRQRFSQNDTMLLECKARADIPLPEELFARLLVLLHNPLAREQLATQILTVLCYLAPLFPKNINLFWQDEIPKMKAYVSDAEDLKLDPSYQETWDDMIVNFLAESLDVIQDSKWVISLGNAFADQYELYASDDDHSALLHRSLGLLLQKVDNRNYVHDKIDWMYKQANIAFPSNRLGLAKAMGLVAASHLDTVLEKLKDILDNVGQSFFSRFLSFFSDRAKMEESDDIHAALALMYGYAARYAPSTVIEARIDALVGTNMLSRLLHVRHPKAKQAVITAIDLLGRAVINAGESGISFPLKRRDQLLDYILTLMGRDDEDDFSDSNIEFLRTQALALSACTTLVSVEPKLTVETRNLVMKATLGFFALPNDPADVVNPLIDNLITLLCAILLTSCNTEVCSAQQLKQFPDLLASDISCRLPPRIMITIKLIFFLSLSNLWLPVAASVVENSGEDGRSRAEQLLHILRQIDQYVSSAIECQRRRGCLAVYEMLLKFRTVCVSGYCALGCHGSCTHNKKVDRSLNRNFSNLPSAFVLPSREALCLGDRTIAYLPRCADTNSEVRKVSAQILDQLFSISLSLPRPATSFTSDIEMSYRALSSLEDVLAILRSDASIDQSEVFNRVVSSVCDLLTKDELVETLHSCYTAICDKVKPSAEGSIQAVMEFIAKRGIELKEIDISRTAQSLLSATVHVTEKYLRQETLGAAFSQHALLSGLFLEHVIAVLNQTPALKGDLASEESSEDNTLRAPIFALTAFFRGGGKIGKKSVEQNYASVLATLTLHLGYCHGLANSGRQEPLRALQTAFQAFCECVGDFEMGKILARDGDHKENEMWINLIGDLACCISIKRPKEVLTISLFLSKFLYQSQRFQREAAAAALSEFVRYSRVVLKVKGPLNFGTGVVLCDGFGTLLEQMVEALCRHVSDDSPAVRRLCLRGLVQIPSIQDNQYTAEVLGVILALLDDLDESVQLTAVSCLLTVLEYSPNDAVEPILLNLSLRLRNLQVVKSGLSTYCLSTQVLRNTKMRANAFAAFGALSTYGVGAHKVAFLEQVRWRWVMAVEVVGYGGGGSGYGGGGSGFDDRQWVHAVFPRLVLHLYDEDLGVRQACRNTLKRISPLTEMEGVSSLFNTHCFTSDHRDAFVFRGDYEDFLRELSRQLTQHLASRIDTYMASIIQAFDAPWPVIQANAIYLSSSMLALSDDQHFSAGYYNQVFGILLGKTNRSADAIVRATCSSALGLLLKSANSLPWRAARLDRVDSAHSIHDKEPTKR
ncbi:hypothetical protein RJ639_010056 [Escallonia herrerae]|uniref:Protein SHOOT GRAVITROPISM 6 n=1 Tax=Escallonia herrerae TaxID=1293975 RepID=A0AA88VT08_9ASTE|nr:hypothetical protein RJ639_010056 [Escallonia herrerae]